MWSIPATHPKTMSHSGRVTVFTKPHRSQTIFRHLAVGNFYRQDFPTTSILTEEHTNRSASLQSTFRWKPRRKIPSHAPTRADLRSGAEIHAPAHETLFGHVPPPTGASATDKPIHPLHEPRRRRKSPSFSLWPLFLHFSVT